MTTTTKQFRAGGKNADVEAPAYLFTGTIATTETDSWTLKNMAQYLKVYNHGTGVARVGFHDGTTLGVDGDESGDPSSACYFEVPSGGSLGFPCEFAVLYIKAPSGAARVSIAITLSTKAVGSLASGMAAADQFDGVEDLDPARYSS